MAVSAPFAVLANETALSLRILVDRVHVEAFVQGGRVAFTKSFTPPRWQHSAVHLIAAESGDGRSAGAGGGTGPMVLRRASVWSMGCGWVDAEDEHPT